MKLKKIELSEKTQEDYDREFRELIRSGADEHQFTSLQDVLVWANAQLQDKAG